MDEMLLIISTLIDCRFTPKGTIDSARIPVISYEPYKGVHEPFAIFSFFYRSQGEIPISSTEMLTPAAECSVNISC